jgi:uroporphyrinogen decarboxylase
MTGHIETSFSHQTPSRLPRGEFWIGTNIFAGLKMEDSINGHIALCREMGMDYISIPVGRSKNDDLGYRIFEPTGIENAAESGLFVIAVLNGSFQRLVDEKGLRLVLADVARDIVEAGRAVGQEAKHIYSLIDACVHGGAKAVMIAEDIAFDSGSFFTPDTFREIFTPLYADLVEYIHGLGASAVFHSCGNISNIIPDIVLSRFDGLSCQVECLDLISLKQTYGTQLTLFTGLSREILNDTSISKEQERLFLHTVKSLDENGGFVLSSSSGIYSLDMLNALKNLYGLVDNTWN